MELEGSLSCRPSNNIIVMMMVVIIIMITYF